MIRTRHLSLLLIAVVATVVGLVGCRSSATSKTKGSPAQSATAVASDNVHPPSKNASDRTTAAAVGSLKSPLVAPGKRTWNSSEPIIDSHVHIVPTKAGITRSLEVFKNAGIEKFVVKSAGVVGSRKYEATLAMMQALGTNMRAFSNIDWRYVNTPGFINRQIADLKQAKKDGIVGIKIFKALGLAVRDRNDKLIPPDSPRLSPLFEACGKLGLIMAWHVADPVAFFEPVTPQNERYDELKLAPDWSFHGLDYPSHATLMKAQETVIRRHPRTVFLLIHFGNYPENLDYVRHLLDTYPNVYIDTSARVPEIGRHPAEEVRALFIKHQDRILFGSDFIAGPTGDMQLGSVSEKEPTLSDAQVFFDRHWQYFETNDRQIDHPTPSQGNWKINAIGLPLDVLRKLYVTNAEKLLFSGAFPVPFAPSSPTSTPAGSAPAAAGAPTPSKPNIPSTSN